MNMKTLTALNIISLLSFAPLQCFDDSATISAEIHDKDKIVQEAIQAYEAAINYYQLQLDSLLPLLKEHETRAAFLEKELQNSSTTHTQEVSSLILQLDHYRHEMSSLTNYIETLKEQISTERQAAEAISTSTNVELLDMIAYFQRLHSDEEKLNDIMRAALDEDAKQHELELAAILDLTQKLHDDNNRLTENNHHTTTNLVNLSTENNQLHSAYADLLRDHDQLLSSNDQLQVQMATLHQERTERENEFTAYHNSTVEKISEQQTQIALLLSQIDEERALLAAVQQTKENELQTALALVQALHDKNANLTTALAQAQNEIDSHKSMIDSIKAEHAAVLDAHKDSHATALNDLIGQIEDHHQAAGTLLKEHDLRNEELLANRELIKNLQEVNAQLNHALNIAAAQNAEAYAHMATVNNMLEMNHNDIQSKIAEREAALHKSYHSKITELQNALSAKENDSQTQQELAAQELAQLRASMEADKQLIYTFSQEMDRLANLDQDSQQKETELRHALELVTGLAEKQERSLADALEAMLAIQQETDLLKAENAKLIATIAQLEKAQRTIRIGAAVPGTAKKNTASNEKKIVSLPPTSR